MAAPEVQLDEVSPGRNGLWLQQEESASDVVVSLRYKTEAPSARVMEAWILPKGLRLKRSVAGEVVAQADKEFVVQDHGDKLRAIVYSAGNVQTLPSGVLAVFHFEKAAAEARIAIGTDDPIFAPATANEGLYIGEALALR
jgi:hypothetical protein